MKDRKKVLVTGADGFIGSHLCEMLFSDGYAITALSQYNSFNNWGWLEDCEILPKIKVVSGDIRDPEFCREVTKDIDVVFHLAALIAIPYSYSAPTSYIDTNVSGTLNICQAAKNNNVSRLIHTSTSEVYGTAQYVPIDEKHPLTPQSPYSASKIGADAIAMSFYHSFNLPVTIARPFNTYGPRQSARAVIPAIVSQIAAGKLEIQLGDLRPTRDFNYVSDTCLGLKLLSESDSAIGEVFNIGSNYEISIGDLLKLINELMGTNVKAINDADRMRPEKSEVFRLWCDNSKIHQYTGFEPRIGLRAGLGKTIEWFMNQDNLRKYKTEIYNV